MDNHVSTRARISRLRELGWHYLPANGLPSWRLGEPPKEAASVTMYPEGEDWTQFTERACWEAEAYSTSAFTAPPADPAACLACGRLPWRGAIADEVMWFAELMQSRLPERPSASLLDVDLKHFITEVKARAASLVALATFGTDDDIKSAAADVACTCMWLARKFLPKVTRAWECGSGGSSWPGCRETWR